MDYYVHPGTIDGITTKRGVNHIQPGCAKGERLAFVAAGIAGYAGCADAYAMKIGIVSKAGQS